jgi:shikimate dehydrogenase
VTRLRLAVVGDPVEHSRSPALHRAFMTAAGIEGTYDAISVAAGEGAGAIDALRAQGYHGLNVTTPLKEEAYARADVRDAAAQASGAANTLLLRESGIEAYNTDGAGAIGALLAAGLADLHGLRILLLGAGPAARAILVALAASGSRVTVWNRNGERAAALAWQYGAQRWRAGDAYDAVFSALPPDAVLADERLRAEVLASPVVIDANYGPRAQLGAHIGRSDVTDGLSMLECGARASFELFLRVAS